MSHASLVARQLHLALRGLDVPAILPGDPIADGVREVLFAGTEVSLRRGPMYYGMNGEPIEDQPARSSMRQVERLRNNHGGEVTDSVSTGGVRSVRVQISTAYLGVDLSTSGPLPLIWETLIFVGDGPLHMLDPVRYATKAAALAGHATLCGAVRQALRG